ncbi:hypothetical protein AB0M48_09300 [Lentzea sp. NPDC051208]|uniref:hypothetical protein n=1 Tax=Lentzea sp. NPDC051208 TaxID=3154642 RepID=UPI003418D724
MTENENNRGWQWLLPVSLVADVSAIVTVLSGSASTAALVIGVVALLIGAGLVAAKIGKPVDKVVLLAVVGIIAGTAAVTVVATRALTVVPGQASGTTTSGSTTTTASSTGTGSSPAVPTPTTTPPPSQEAPGVKRTSKDRLIQLTRGYGVDLDSGALDWGAVRTNASDERYDLSYDGYNLIARGHLAPVKADATLDDCVSAGYKSSMSGKEIAPDATFCVKTNGKTFARVRLADVKSGELLALDALVWSPKT